MDYKTIVGTGPRTPVVERFIPLERSLFTKVRRLRPTTLNTWSKTVGFINTTNFIKFAKVQIFFTLLRIHIWDIKNNVFITLLGTQ